MPTFYEAGLEPIYTQAPRVRRRPGRLRYPTSFSYEDAIAESMRRTTPETLEQVIHRLHRRQQFYLTHTEELPSW